MARTGRVSKRRGSSGTLRYGAARVAVGLVITASPLAAIADAPGAAPAPPATAESERRSRDPGEPPAEATAPDLLSSGSAPLEALQSWYLVACDPATGAAVVGRTGGDLRVVRPGDQIEALEVVGLRSDRVLLRPAPGARGLEEIREVWLLRAERAGEPRLRVLRTRDESLRAARGALPVATEEPAPKGARTVRRPVPDGRPR